MKKIVAATLFTSMFASAGAMAAAGGTGTTDIQLVAGTYVAVGNVTTNINLARQYNFLPVAARAGFVKNEFEGTLSANVIAGVQDFPATSRYGVIAASNKGYNVFTGSSVGGSVGQCGAQVDKDASPNLAAAEVVAGNLLLTNANGCNRPL